MVRYIVTEQARAERSQYGIAAITERKRVDQIDDVALTLEETMRLVSLLQDNGVAPEHFRDVVDDYLSGLMMVE